jgi:uncharacterized protein YciI
MRWTVSLIATLSLLAAPLAQAESPSSAGSVTAASSPQQFLYMLRLVPRLHDDAAWTEADNAAVSRHFEHLKRATAEGKVVLAGRTLEPGDRTFGIVIFEAADENEAQRFMASDPAVVAGVMTATLHPYAVALQRER